MTTIPAIIPNAFDAALRGPDIYARLADNLACCFAVDEITLPDGRVIVLDNAEAYCTRDGLVTLVDFSSITDAESGDDITAPCDLRPLIQAQYPRSIERACEGEYR